MVSAAARRGELSSRSKPGGPQNALAYLLWRKALDFRYHPVHAGKGVFDI